MKAAADKEISDLSSKYNVSLFSVKDAAKVSDMTLAMKKETEQVLSDPSLNPTEQYGKVLDIKRKYEGNQELFNIAESNKNMQIAYQKVPNSLRPYFDKYIRPELETPNGVVWSGNFDIDPQADINNMQSNLMSAISKTSFKDENGNDMEGIKAETIHNYINDNIDNVLERNRGFALQMASDYEAAGGAHLDLDSDIDRDKLKKYATERWWKMNEEYAYQGEKYKPKGTYVNVHNYPQKLDDPAVPLSELFTDLSPYLKGVASNVAAVTNSDGSIDLVDMAQKTREKFKESGTAQTFLTRNTYASSPMQANYVWTSKDSGATFAVKNKSNTKSMMQSMGSSIRSGEIDAESIKDVYIMPDLNNSSLFGEAASKNGTSSEVYVGNAVSSILRKASDNGFVFMESNNVTSQYSIMHDGTVGSVAKISLPASASLGGKKSVAQEIFERFPTTGNSNAWDKLSDMGTGTFEFPIKSGGTFTNIKVEVNYIDGEKVFSFNVIKSAAPLNGRSLSNSGYNTSKGKPSTTDWASGMSTNPSFTIK